VATNFIYVVTTKALTVLVAMSEPAPTDDNDPVALRRGTAARRVYCAVKAEVAKFGLCPWSDAEIGSLVGLTGTDVGAAVGRLRTMGLVHDVLRPAGEDARFGGRTLRAGGKGLTLTPGNPATDDVDAERIRQEAAARQRCQAEIAAARHHCQAEIELIRANATIARHRLLNQGGVTSETP